MARGSNFENDNKPFFVDIKGWGEGEKIHLRFSSKNDAGETVEEPDERAVTGMLKHFKHDIDKWDNQQFQLVLEDAKEKEVYFVKSRVNGIGQNILNSLLSVPEFNEPLTISVYNSKKDGQPKVGMYLGKDWMKWGLDWHKDLAPHIVESTVTEKGKQVVKKDYFALNEFLLKSVEEHLNGKLGGASPEAEGKPAEGLAPTEPAVNLPEEDDELPF